MGLVSKVVVGILFLTFASAATPAQIQPALLSQLEIQGLVDVIVSMKVGTSRVLQNLEKNGNSQVVNNSPKARQNRITEVVSALEHHAEESQKSILSFLSEFIAAAAKKSSVEIKFQSLWITNQIVIRSADAELISAMAQFQEIKSIELNEIVATVIEPEAFVPVALDESDILTWGVQNIEAAKVWNSSEGNAGEGAIVAIIDTGVMWTHEALKENFMGGEHGWLDPYNYSKTPVDFNGHGTHVTGTILGKNGIGVAPKAKWISCLGCGPVGCLRGELVACGQFAICPTLFDGSNKDCSKAAHVVSNSWAGGQGQDFYDDVIAAWHAAGVIPVFAAGNEGANGCGSASSPGDSSRVISVGASNETNGITWFSGRGPSVYGTLKPDISAPGINIKSSYIWSNTSYASTAGTSMACPHVTGVIALLQSAKPSLTYDEVKKFLFDGAEKKLQTGNEVCGGVIDTQYPNYFHGHGKLNAFNSLTQLLTNSGKYVSSSFNILALLLVSSAIMILK